MAQSLRFGTQRCAFGRMTESGAEVKRKIVQRHYTETTLCDGVGLFRASRSFVGIDGESRRDRKRDGRSRNLVRALGRMRPHEDSYGEFRAPESHP